MFWMPLTLDEKLNMIMNDRDEDEMQMMIFLLEEEYQLNEKAYNQEKVFEKIERALDN